MRSAIKVIPITTSSIGGKEKRGDGTARFMCARIPQLTITVHFTTRHDIVHQDRDALPVLLASSSSSESSPSGWSSSSSLLSVSLTSGRL